MTSGNPEAGPAICRSVPDVRKERTDVRFCASVNGIALAGLRLTDIAHNFGNCYKRYCFLTVELTLRIYESRFKPFPGGKMLRMAVPL